jgi:hypothetical protein
LCLGAAPTSPADYASAFAGIRNSDREWIQADVANPVTLGDGRIVWIFADTMIGRMDSGGVALQPTGRQLVHNSFVVQDGPCFTPVMAGSRGARTSLIPDHAPAWDWPFTGAYDPSQNVLKVFSLRLQPDPRLGPPFNFFFAGFDVATFSLPGLNLIDSRPIAGLSSTVGPPSSEYFPNWNTGGLAVGGYFYGYGRDGNTPQGHIGSNKHFLARAPLASVATAPWEYYAGPSTLDPTQPSWSILPADAVPLDFIADASAPPQATNPITYLQVIPHKGGFLAAGKLSDLVSDDISTWQAPTVAGPWTYTGRAATVPALSYCARVVVDILSGPRAQWCPFGTDTNNIPAAVVQFTSPLLGALSEPTTTTALP